MWAATAPAVFAIVKGGSSKGGSLPVWLQETHQLNPKHQAATETKMSPTVAEGYRRIQPVLKGLPQVGSGRSWTAGFILQDKNVIEDEKLPNRKVTSSLFQFRDHKWKCRSIISWGHLIHWHFLCHDLSRDSNPDFYLAHDGMYTSCKLNSTLRKWNFLSH